MSQDDSRDGLQIPMQGITDAPSTDVSLVIEKTPSEPLPEVETRLTLSPPIVDQENTISKDNHDIEANHSHLLPEDEPRRSESHPKQPLPSPHSASHIITIPPSTDEMEEPEQQEARASGDSEEEEDADIPDNAWTRNVIRIQMAVQEWCEKHGTQVKWAFYLALMLGYLAYFSYAMHYSYGDEGSVRLMTLTLLIALYLLFRLLEFLHLRGTFRLFSFKTTKNNFLVFRKKIRLNLLLTSATAIFVFVYIMWDVARYRPYNLRSLGGIFVFVLLFYIFSHKPAKVRWRPVVWGILMQFILALVILRTDWGYFTFAYLGKRATEFMSFSDTGAKFVFGDQYKDHFFAFKVLPLVVFFSTFVDVMYYVGFMPFIVRNVGRFLCFCLGTSPAESLSAAGNIFFGQSEAPLLIKPFLHAMTKSELHSVLTGGFATIAGAVMGAYIFFGVPANHLLSASVMSAPAALAMSKLFYPETEPIQNNRNKIYITQRGDERNIIEAASNGAAQSISLVANIAVNLIAFIAILNCVNASLVWLGDRVGMSDPKLSFELICSYLFSPISFLMGVDEEDALVMGELIGTKTFLNEFVAYIELSKYINNRKIVNEYLKNFTLGLSTHPTGKWHLKHDSVYLVDLNRTLPYGIMSDRSIVVATYALCGFSNFASMGLMLGAMTSLCPERRHAASDVIFRAMISGNVACFMTACIAGLLYRGD